MLDMSVCLWIRSELVSRLFNRQTVHKLICSVCFVHRQCPIVGLNSFVLFIHNAKFLG